MHKVIMVACIMAGTFVIAHAAEEKKVEPSTISVRLIGADQAAQWKGKRVMVVLRSGKEIEGTVGEVTGANLELKQLAGKDFYDAIVKLDEIAAFQWKAR